MITMRLGLLAVPLILLIPRLAVSENYYECVGFDGKREYQLAPCSKTSQGRLIKDDTPARTVQVGDSGQLSTTQLQKVGTHFHSQGKINGTPFPMMVDTGASFVTMSSHDAQRAGISLQGGKHVNSQTANGTVSGVIIQVASVEFNGHVVRDVPIMIQTSGKPSPIVLLGMSFLRNFEISVSNDVLTLHRR